MRDAFLFDATRSPVGKQDGALADTRPDELAAQILDALAERTDVSPETIEDVVMGCVTQIDEQGGNIGRMAPLIAGWPVTTTGTTVNRMCGSGLQAVNFAAHNVTAGMKDLVVGAGVESMSRCEMLSDMGPISDTLHDRFEIVSQGVSADMIADEWDLERRELDELAVESHRRATRAKNDGRFDREITPVEADTEDGGTRVVDTDEGPRPETSVEAVGKLDPVFTDDGVITPATSSQISDGAAAILVGSRPAAEELDLEPRARIRATATAGVDPTIMLTGPIPATRRVLDRADLELGDIDLFEVNEAFASVVLAWADELDEDRESLLERTNVNGGAMALGHPLGATGAKLLTTCLHEMERRDARLGLTTLCIGYGQAVATIIERG